MSEIENESFLWLLRTEPTVRRWSIELREIVSGNREHSIASFGSASGYVKSLLFNSRDTSTAEHCFDEALRRLVELWHPLASPDTERDLRTLQLLGTFTPSEGLGRSLSLLRSLNALDAIGNDLRVQQLKPAALQVLEQYFPIEQSPRGAFAEYVAQLKFNLAHARYATYAVARLRDLRKLRSIDLRLSREIVASPQVLRGLLAIFSPGLQQGKRDLQFLSEIYRLCLYMEENTRLLALFGRTIEDLGFNLANEDTGPYLNAAGSKWRSAILLRGNDFDLYYAKVYLPLSRKGVDAKLAEANEISKAEETPVPYELAFERAHDS